MFSKVVIALALVVGATARTDIMDQYKESSVEEKVRATPPISPLVAQWLTR